MFAASLLSPLDAATEHAMPLRAVPIQGAFEPLDAPGRRLLAARDGIYVEACSEALYIRVRCVAMHTPYGETSEALTLRGPRIPKALARNLMERSLAAHPREMAALIVADAADPSGYRLIEPEATGFVGRVTYADHGYDEARLVIDAHSHGPYPARFSGVDDESDRSRCGPHVSMVFGHCIDRPSTKVAVRVCVGHYLIPLSDDLWTELFA